MLLDLGAKKAWLNTRAAHVKESCIRESGHSDFARDRLKLPHRIRWQDLWREESGCGCECRNAGLGYSGSLRPCMFPSRCPSWLRASSAEPEVATNVRVFSLVHFLSRERRTREHDSTRPGDGRQHDKSASSKVLSHADMIFALPPASVKNGANFRALRS